MLERIASIAHRWLVLSLVLGLSALGSGLSTIEAGARLRYEFTRRFAPYIGVEFERAFGETADLRRLEGEPTRDTRLVAGIRFWF